MSELPPHKTTGKKGRDEKDMPLVEHLEELRWHLMRSIIAILVITVAVFFGKTLVFDGLIMGPRNDDFLTYTAFCKLSHWLGLGDAMCMKPVPFKMIVTGVSTQFLTHIQVSLTLGFVMAFPYIVWEMWRFVEPGLTDIERRASRGGVLITSFLFFLGVLFGYFILTPFSINFFAAYIVSPDVANHFTLASYVSTITMLIMASGIMFELPILVYFLTSIGLLTPQFMRTNRRYALVFILFIAAIITPADVWSQILVSIPVYFLYEISIFVAARVVKKRQLEEKELIKTEGS